MKKNNNNAKTFGYFFYTMWWKILLILLVGAIPTSIIITAVTRIKDDQIIEFFIDSDIKDTSIYDKFYKSLPKDDRIIEVRSTTIKNSDSEFMAILKTKVGICADILILSETFLSTRDTFWSYSYRFNTEEENYLSSNYSFTKKIYYDKFVGFKIYEKNNDLYNQQYCFTDYFNFTDSMYMFIDSTSTELNRNSIDKFSVAVNSFIKFLDVNKKK